MLNILDTFVEEVEIQDVLTLSKYNPSLPTSTKKISIVDQSGFAPDLIDPEGLNAQKFNGIYENGEQYSVTFKILELDTLSETYTECNISLLGYTCSVEGFDIVQENATTIRISGTAKNAFKDSYFKFLTLNDTIEILSASTTEYKALIEWKIPDKKIMTAFHNVTLNITTAQPGYGNSMETITISQEVSWRWQPALQEFQRVISGGAL